MSRYQEEKQLVEIRALRREARKLVQRIVDARLKGGRDDDAIAQLARNSNRQVELTRPVFEVAA